MLEGHFRVTRGWFGTTVHCAQMKCGHSTTTALWETAEGRHSRGGEEVTARLGEAEPRLHKGLMNVMGQGSYRIEGSDRRTWGTADSRRTANKPSGEQR